MYLDIKVLMGGLWSKVGSDPYYASYERSFERLKAESDKLKVIHAGHTCRFKLLCDLLVLLLVTYRHCSFQLLTL